MVPLRSDAGIELAGAEVLLRSSHQRISRVSVLDDLFNPLPGLIFTGVDGYAIDGSVSGDASRYIRRTLSLTLANPDGVWTPRGEGSAFYWDKLLRVERGIRAGGQDFLAPMGVFLIDTPEVERGRLSLTGADRIDRATRSEFTGPATYAAGTRVGVVIQDILTDAGIGASRWSVDDGGSTLGIARTFEAGEERLPQAVSLATSFSLDVFADSAGYIVVRPKRDPETVPSAWTFQEGVDATHVGLSKRWSRDRFYNHVLVSGESSEINPPVRAEASITDPASPLRITGAMGDRLFKYTSAMITTQAQADQVALTLLWEHALIEEEIRIDHVPNPTLEPGDVITIVDEESVTNDRYLIDTISVPLAGGTATVNAKKVRSIA